MHIYAASHMHRGQSRRCMHARTHAHVDYLSTTRSDKQERSSELFKALQGFCHKQEHAAEEIAAAIL